MLEVLEVLVVEEEEEEEEDVEGKDADHYQGEDVEEEDSRVDCNLQPCCSRSNRS